MFFDIHENKSHSGMYFIFYPGNPAMINPNNQCNEHNCEQANKND